MTMKPQKPTTLPKPPDFPASAPPPKPPIEPPPKVPDYTIVCRGSILLGNNCGDCPQCKRDRELLAMIVKTLDKRNDYKDNIDRAIAFRDCQILAESLGYAF